MSLGRKWLWAGWMIVSALGAGVATQLGANRSWAQGPATAVQDTLTDASGSPAVGTAVVSWAAFTTAAGQPVPAGSLSTTLGAGGALSLNLLPNAGATPMGSYYTAVFHLSDGTTSREFWVVPVSATGTVRLAGIRNQVLPATMAMQTVSKAYVDTAVAKAMAGIAPGGDVPYLLKTGDTMAGPLLLAADPTAAMQAVDKHYVDAALAAVAAGGGSAGTAGGDLAGTFPNPVVAAVHATSGTLDGTAVGGTAPAAGTFTTVTAVAAGSSVPGFITGLTYIYGAGNTTLCNFCTYADPAGSLYFGQGQTFGQVTEIADGDGEANDSFALYMGKTPNAFDHPTNSDVMCTNVACSLANTMSWGWSSQANGFAGTAQRVLTLRAGFSSPAAGLVSCDTSTAGDHGCTLLAGGYHETLTTPASSSATCSAGDFTDDASFHYVCVAASTWKRVALSSF